MPESKKRLRNGGSPDTSPYVGEKIAPESTIVTEGAAVIKTEDQFLVNVSEKKFSTNNCTTSEIPTDRSACVQPGALQSSPSSVGIRIPNFEAGVFIGPSPNIPNRYILLQDTELRDKAIVSIFGVGN